MLSTGLSDPLRNLNIDELEILNFLDLMPGSQQIDSNVRVDNHLLKLLLILIIHRVIKPSSILLST